MPPQCLPHELEELILCHLLHDLNSLKACSLVCYRFGIVAQRLLFNNIVVDFSQSSNGPNPRPALLHEFLQTTPRITNSIRGIDIIADSYQLKALDTTFLPCPSFLPNLQGFSLDTDSARPIYWGYLSPHAQRSLYGISRAHRIVNLRFRRVFELPMSLIAECPALVGLSLISVTFQQESMLQISDATRQPPRLRSLHLSISSDAFQAFTSFLTGSPPLLDVSALVKLSVSIFSPRFDYNELNALLRAVGGSLEVFYFSPMHADNSQQRPPLHLHELPRLRILRLRCIASEGYSPHKDGSKGMNLQPIRLHVAPKTAQHLEEVSIKVDYGWECEGPLSEGNALPWLAIDAGLSALPSIRKVIAYTCEKRAHLQLSVLKPTPFDLAGVFPRLHSRSLLRAQSAFSTLGFLAEANDTELLLESFRRHNMV